MNRLTLSLALSFGLAGLAGCGVTDPNADPIVPSDAALYRFSDCADVKDYVADAWLETVVRARYGGWWGATLAEGDGASPPAAGDRGSDAPTDFSETNTQEEGVDEPDIVKTDGTHVYVVQSQRQELTIVQSWPVEDAEVVGRVAIEGYPMSMFLSGDRAVVFSQIWGWNEAGDTPYRDGYATRMTVIDVSDRGAPAIERTIDVDGWMSSARLVEDDLYVVLDSYAYVPNELWELTWSEDLELPEYDWEASDEEQEAIRHQAREILRPLVEEMVDDTDIDQILPKQYLGEPGQNELDVEGYIACRDVYHPEGTSEPGVLSVAHLDLGDDDGELSATGVMANGWTVYASQKNLYVAQSSWFWWWGWGDLDLDTHIHKFSLEGESSRYQGSGSVQGWLWNQFALSEFDGYLRVATTDIDWWWGTQEGDEEGGNNVFVLDERLRQVGEVTGFAKGEQIYASRFMGDEGYVVTFRQIDPLFTFDLSDPESPKLMGELEMPGFSSYLHPYGYGRLIGVGMDGDEEGRISGLSVNLFDVSDLKDPRRIDQIVVNSEEWSWSEALWNHHAFTLHRDVLNFPIYTWNHDQGFSGMLSVAVTEDSLTEIGRVGHAELVDDSECIYAFYDERETRECPDYYWYAAMRRSVVIEDNLFSISDYGIKVTDLNDPSTEITRVLFWPLD